MDDPLIEINNALSAAGKELSEYAEDIKTETTRCNQEKLTLVTATRTSLFCPQSRETATDPVDASVTIYTFTNVLGNKLTVRNRGGTVESIELLVKSNQAFACTGAACQNVTIGNIAANGTRTIAFAGTSGVDASGASATLTGSLLAARAGLPPVACDGDKRVLFQERWIDCCGLREWRQRHCRRSHLH